jgi:predicted Zn-dependent peptidase
VIKYNRFQLANGIKVIHSFDSTISTVVLNALYNVGARDERENCTGFAHLFEHLMFAGSRNVLSFDQEIEKAGGQNNAFTNNEFTNYYISVPIENVETAFWLESDRLLALNINEESLNIQRGVVIEEFKQRCFNAPFGQLWHHVRELLYTKSPYRWPTIGKNIEHIENATLNDVQNFYDAFYTPQNLTISIVGNISIEETKVLTEKWFGSILKPGFPNPNNYIIDENSNDVNRLHTKDLSPNPAVFLLWKGPSIKENHSLALDIFSDMLGGSEVSDLTERMVKELKLCNAAECFYLRGLDEGIFVLYGILNDGINQDMVERELLNTLNQFIEKREQNNFVFESTKNKVYSALKFDHINPINLAQKLAYWENLNKPEEINNEANEIQNLNLSEVLKSAKSKFDPKNMSVLYYSPIND